MFKKGNQGFTVLEIMMVIILMGIIGIMAAPSTDMIRRHEVRKAAKEICLDLTEQRAKAMSMGKDYIYLMELTDEDSLGHCYDYKLSFKDPSGNLKQIEKGKKGNSKNISINMESLDGEGKIIDTLGVLKAIQFDSYGYMMNTKPSPQEIHKLIISIKYGEKEEVKIDFYGITGKYTIN